MTTFPMLALFFVPFLPTVRPLVSTSIGRI